MRISDWSSDVCSSDLHVAHRVRVGRSLANRSYAFGPADAGEHLADHGCTLACLRRLEPCLFVVISDRRNPPTDRGWFRDAGGDFQRRSDHCPVARYGWFGAREHPKLHQRSEEQTSELQSLMHNSYAAFVLKIQKHYQNIN